MAGRFRWSTLLRFFAGMLLIGMLFRMVGLDALRAAAAPARAHPGWIGAALAAHHVGRHDAERAGKLFKKFASAMPR